MRNTQTMKKPKLFFLTVSFGFFWFVFLRPVFLGGITSYIIVSGISMEPTLVDGDLAILTRQDHYDVGDIVAYKVQGGNVIHRIVGGSTDEGYLTQGDNKTDVDPWTPNNEQILGKMRIHIPGGGKVLINMRSPIGFTGLLGLAGLLVANDSGKKVLVKRRGRQMKRQHNSTLDWLPSSSLMSIIEIFAFSCLLFLFAAVYGYLNPVEQMENVEVLSYEHKSDFSFVVHTAPSSLYPDQTIGPVYGSQADSESTIVFRGLARSLDIDFSYALNNNQIHDISGEVSFFLDIKAGSAWINSRPVGQSTLFTGPMINTKIHLDFAEIQSFIDMIEKETEYVPGSYEISLRPLVEWQGQAGDRKLTESYAPLFSFTLNSSQIIFGSELSQNEVKTIEDNVLLPKKVNILGLSIPVVSLRTWGTTGVLVSIILAVILTAFNFFVTGNGRAGMVQARYGSLIINVRGADLSQEKTIHVDSMQDLARLAQRTGTMILHQPLSDQTHLYFLPDGNVTYIYQVR